MTTLSDHLRWLAQCSSETTGGGHLTPGDIFHRGLGSYNTSRPYPNGLPVVKGAMSDCEWGRAKLARARRDIEEHKAEFRVREIISGVVPEILEVFLQATRVVA